MWMMIVLSMLAVYGFIQLLLYLIQLVRPGAKESGGKLVLVPDKRDEGLEGKIRIAFLEDIPSRLGTDGCLYVIADEGYGQKDLLEKLALEHPQLVLLDTDEWGKMMNSGSSII